MKNKPILVNIVLFTILTIYVILAVIDNNIKKIVNYDEIKINTIINKQNGINGVCDILDCEKILVKTNNNEYTVTIINNDKTTPPYKIVKGIDNLKRIGLNNLTEKLNPIIYINNNIYILRNDYIIKLLIIWIFIIYLVFISIHFTIKLYRLNIAYNGVINLVDTDAEDKLNSNSEFYDFFIHKLAIGLEVLETCITELTDKHKKSEILEFTDINSALIYIRNIISDLKTNKTIDSTKLLKLLHYVKQTSINKVLIDADGFDVNILDPKIKDIIEKNSFIFYSDKLLSIFKRKNPISKIRISNTLDTLKIEIISKYTIECIDIRSMDYLNSWIEELGCQSDIDIDKYKIICTITSKKTNELFNKIMKIIKI